MKKIMIGFVLLTLVSAQVAGAWNVGVFGSRWDHKDGDAVWGGGVLVLPESLPLEFRATLYEHSSRGRLQANPLDFGLALGLTRMDKVSVTAIGGGTHYWVDAKHSSPDNKFGWYVGGRVEVTTPHNFSGFGELMYRGAKLDDADFSGPTLNLGILF